MKAWEQTEQQKRTNRIKQLIHTKQQQKQSLNFNIKQISTNQNKTPQKDHKIEIDKRDK